MDEEERDKIRLMLAILFPSEDYYVSVYDRSRANFTVSVFFKHLGITRLFDWPTAERMVWDVEYVAGYTPHPESWPLTRRHIISELFTGEE